MGFAGVFPPLVSNESRRRSNFLIEFSMKQDPCSLEAPRSSGKIHVSTSGCWQEVWIFARSELRGRAACDTEGRGRAKTLWCWMMGKHHSKDDTCIVPSCTKDLGMGMWFVLYPGQWQGKGSGWQFPARFWGNAEPWHDHPSLPLDLFNKHQIPECGQAPALPLLRHPRCGKECSCQGGILTKKSTQERKGKFSPGSACSEPLIWAVPLSSTPAASPSRLWWLHTPALKHRAQQHWNNSS